MHSFQAAYRMSRPDCLNDVHIHTQQLLQLMGADVNGRISFGGFASAVEGGGAEWLLTLLLLTPYDNEWTASEPKSCMTYAFQAAEQA